MTSGDSGGLESSMISPRSFLKKSTEISIECALGRENAIKIRDSIAEAVFDELVHWLMKECSVHLMKNVDQLSARYIGVLDLPGFNYVPEERISLENPQITNGFDQFLINYCNEQLHQLFIQVCEVMWCFSY